VLVPVPVLVLVPVPVRIFVPMSTVLLMLPFPGFETFHQFFQSTLGRSNLLGQRIDQVARVLPFGLVVGRLGSDGVCRGSRKG
jgi:hypothetical protein